MSTTNETGNLQVNSENILPIIKKWLYSDTDIFLRELVSNGCDAISKLQRLSNVGDVELPEDEKFEIHVKINKEEKTLTISDNGIGMDFDEVKLYINQIAKSSAAEFIEKFKSENNDIIGHFGLGFYSAFMAADIVKIDTLSYKDGAAPVKWVSSDGVSYEMSDGEKASRGTDIVLTLNDDAKEFLEEHRVRSVLRKYMQFVPVEIYLDVEGKESESDVAPEAEGEQTAPEPPKPENDTQPLWLKNASDISDDDYTAFYHKLFTDFNPPLFWIHLNMDYPHRLRGILYFPKLNHELEYVEGQVKLYCSQVFIADNIKEVIPEFLLLLKGVVDCPDLPLNVSRSFLQNDGYASKLSSYITKKVADKLNGMFKTERGDYEKFWDDISPFIKYGCIKENDFYEKIKSSIIFKTPKGAYMTKDEYLAANEGKIGKKIYYATDEKQQSRYISLFEDQGIDIALLTTRLDTPFISFIESKEYSAPENERIRFIRIDSALSDTLKADTTEETNETAAENVKLIEMFKTSLSKKSDKLKVEVETLKTPDVPAIILLSEESRRMQEMSKYFAQMPGMNFDSDEKLVLNRANNLIQLLLKLENPEKASIICEQVYDLAQISHKPLSPSEMNEFIIRSNKVLAIIAE